MPQPAHVPQRPDNTPAATTRITPDRPMRAPQQGGTGLSFPFPFPPHDDEPAHDCPTRADK